MSAAQVMSLAYRGIKQEAEFKTTDYVLKIVCETWMPKCQHVLDLYGYDNDLNDLLLLVTKKVRTKPLSNVRATHYYWVQNIFNLTLKEIGFSCGIRDHSTVIHGIQTYKDLVETERKMSELHLELCDIFGIDNKLKLKV